MKPILSDHHISIILFTSYKFGFKMVKISSESDFFTSLSFLTRSDYAKYSASVFIKCETETIKQNIQVT